MSEQLNFSELWFPGRKMLSVAEVAERLAVSQRHVLNLIDEGKLHALNVAGETVSGRRALRIPVAWYEDFVRSRAI